MWPSAGLALILLVGLNGSVPQRSSPTNQGMSARPTRLEARFELPGRGERTVIRATSRRVMPATVRRLGSGQPAVPPADDFVAVATRGAAAVGGSLTGPRNALRETPYAPRAPPGSGGASLHAG